MINYLKKHADEYIQSQMYVYIMFILFLKKAKYISAIFIQTKIIMKNNETNKYKYIYKITINDKKVIIIFLKNV